MWAFLNPVFLIGLAALAVPLLLHLLQRRRKIQMPFSTVRFLKLAQKQSANRIRLENWLLWLLRTLILTALVLAFAGPVWRTRAGGRFLGNAPRDVALVLDVSYSMTYETGRGTVWEDAVSAAEAVLSTLQKGDRVCVFLAADDVRPLLVQPTSDHDLARTLINAQRPLGTSSQLRPAVLAALQALDQPGQRERELHIFTDGQALPWAELADVSPPAGGWPPVFVSLLGVTSPQNTAPLAVEIQPPLLLTNTAAQLTVTLTQTGPATDTTVSLFLNDRELARRSADGSVTFALPPLPAGHHLGRIETPQDPLVADNTFYFVLRVQERLPVLVAASETDAFFLMRALNPTGSLFDVRRIEPEELNSDLLAEYRCLVLANALPLPGQALLNVEKFIREGGTLVIFPGDRAAVSEYARWSVLPMLPAAVEEITEPRRQPMRLLQPQDPIFAGLKLPPGVVPTLNARRWLRPVVEPAPTGEVLVMLGEETPLLWSRAVGAGRVLLFAISADRHWSDLPLSPWFLPLIHQIVLTHAGADKTPLYEWGSQPGFQRDPDRAINLPRAESNLQPIRPEQLPLPNAHVARDVPELLRVMAQHRQGRPLTELMLWLVVVLALVESWLAHHRLRTSPARSVVISPTRATASTARVSESVASGAH